MPTRPSEGNINGKGARTMEPVLETLEQQAVVVEEEQPVAAVTQAAEEVEESEELVELLLREITIDGMCGVY